MLLTIRIYLKGAYLESNREYSEVVEIQCDKWEYKRKSDAFLFEEIINPVREDTKTIACVPKDSVLWFKIIENEMEEI